MWCSICGKEVNVDDSTSYKEVEYYGYTLTYCEPCYKFQHGMEK